MLKVAVIGAGEWGLNHLRVFNELGGLGAICEIDPQRASIANSLYPKTPYKIFFAVESSQPDKDGPPERRRRAGLAGQRTTDQQAPLKCM